MSNIDKNFDRHFVRYLRDHGITIEPGGNHARLVKDGTSVGGISTTAAGDVVYRSAIKQLIERGLLPREAARLRFG